MGKGGRIFIIDDPQGDALVEQACDPTREATRKWWWEEVARQRLNDPNIKPVVIMARLHHADLPGVVLPDQDLGYEHLPERADKLAMTGVDDVRSMWRRMITEALEEPELL